MECENRIPLLCKAPVLLGVFSFTEPPPMSREKEMGTSPCPFLAVEQKRLRIQNRPRRLGLAKQDECQTEQPGAEQ